MSTPQVQVNGREVRLDVGPHVSALDWLRSQGLTGAKEGCAEGECGACAVMMARTSTTGDGTTEWLSINACLIPAAGLAGQEVVTAEGLGTAAALHPVQQEMAVRGGSQCGYCTPGFVCSMAAEYYRAGRGGDHGSTAASANGQEEPDPNGPGAETDAEHGPNGFDLHALSGNLCRCTGYRPIKDAAYALGEPSAADVLASRRDQPPPVTPSTRVTADTGEFVRPTDLAEALQLLAERPDALVVAGCTD
jgi:xanthine dehydrogenase small subunit